MAINKKVDQELFYQIKCLVKKLLLKLICMYKKFLLYLIEIR